MTEIKKLEIKHIAPYLPYGLKWYHSNKDGTHPITLYNANTIISAVNNQNYKIVLRPMSDLYKEINGEVGIVELFKLYETRVFDTDKKYDVVFDAPIISYEWVKYDTIKSEEGILRYLRKTSNMGDLVHSFRYDPELRRFSMYDDTNRRPLAIAYQLELFSYLFANHYDIFGLLEQGLAINKNDIE